jgi:hypothetical protein
LLVLSWSIAGPVHFPNANRPFFTEGAELKKY